MPGLTEETAPQAAKMQKELTNRLSAARRHDTLVLCQFANCDQASSPGHLFSV